jgi:selenocysteine-specific elongation factor
MKHIIVGTAGHIDHGKTSLVKALTGIDADRLKEEKQRGITIDIGFADLAIDDVRIGFVDVPGHERFVKNMLAGAHGLDLVMLVVAADESVMPQTREHFDICRLLDVKAGLVALTKSDMVDEELLELARAEVEDFVRGSFLAEAPIVAVSSRTGDGIDELKQELAKLAARTQPKAISAVMRLPVDRAFSIKGFGTVVTGTLIAGQLKLGDELDVLPSGIRTRVRNLQVHGHDTDHALAGQRTAINLQGLNVEQAQRGVVLAPAGRLGSTRMVDARLHLLPSAPRPLVHRARVRFHHGTSEVLARVVLLEGGEGSAESGTSGREPGRNLAIEPGNSRLVQLRLEKPVTALPGDHFILRSYSPQVTIGGGVILDARPEKHRKSARSAYDRLSELEHADFDSKIAAFVEMAGLHAMTLPELAARTGATDEQLAKAIARQVSAGLVLEVSNSPATLMSAPALKQLETRVVGLLEDHHRREPLSLGLGREEVRERVFGDLKPEIVRSIVSRLAEGGKIVVERDSMRLASHRMALSATDAAHKQRLEATFKNAGLQAGTLDEAAKSAGVSPDLARKLYNLLAAEKRVLRIDDFVFHADSIEKLKERVRAQKAISSRIDVAVFKEITGGLTRKYAIPLLEYLDRERVTRRVGNEREIL